MLKYFLHHSRRYYNFTTEFAFLLKKKKTTTIQQVTGGKIPNLVIENPTTFSKDSTTQENIRISRLKENCKTYAKKKTSNQKLNQWLKLARWTLSIGKQTGKRC